MDLQGKIAIVTGGAVRLGRAMSLALAQAGCDLAVHFWDSSKEVEQILGEISSIGSRAISIDADLSDPVNSVSKILSTAYDHFGQVDILVNNAGIFEAASLAQTDETNWDRHFSINLKAPVFLCREFFARLHPEQRAHIVNISDGIVRMANRDFLAYTLTKTAISNVTQMLAQELAPQVQVNAIAPGAILPQKNMQDEEFRELCSAIPLGRTGTPEDVTRCLLFLLESDFITGEIVHLTGGQKFEPVSQQKNEMPF